jgi:hypothetical protein
MGEISMKRIKVEKIIRMETEEKTRIPLGNIAYIPVQEVMMKAEGAVDQTILVVYIEIEVSMYIPTS